ncbi:MAG: FAD-dependent oxidoreductase [Acidimicrobiia bacterium]|nr:FAD-dependent oxidoreductase [Acidimicrobiia bacterium]
MTTETGQFERLFSPLQIGPMRVPNRICETTNTIGAGRLAGVPDATFTAHHLAKAQGGTGWIGNETWLLNSPLPNESADEFFPGAGATRFPIYMLPNFAEEVSRFCEAIHATGAVVVFQLTQLNFTVAASSVPIVEAYDWVPHALTEDEIEAAIDTYAMAAGQCAAAGVDGIEIHCTHESLPQTFLSPALNRRADRWGGDAVGRTLFVRRTLERVRERIGTSTALGIRVGAEEAREGGYSLWDMREMVTHIAATGTLDFLDVDVGHSWGRQPYVPPSFIGHAENRDAAKALRADVAPVPVLFSGRVNDPVVAEDLLAKGFCDLVGMTRAGIADPDFPTKAREGRLGEIRRCIGCNRCIGDAVTNDAPDMFKRAVCSVNPAVGNEALHATLMRPAQTPKRVVVVGGGAAGLEAARNAAGRGHDVVLLERTEALGGQVRLASRIPGRDSFEDFILYEENQMRLLGVDVRFGVDVDAGSVLAFEPDAIVCATGSVPRTPDTPGVDAADVVQGWEVLAGTAGEIGERVAVVSQEDHYETPGIASFLAAADRRVEIFHKWTGIGSRVERYSIGPILRRLEEGGVVVHTGLRLARVEDGKLELVSAHTGEPRLAGGFDTVVLVYGSVPDTRVHDGLREAGFGGRLFLAGSAWVPRLLAEATQHGARVGLEV